MVARQRASRVTGSARRIVTRVRVRVALLVRLWCKMVQITASLQFTYKCIVIPLELGENSLESTRRHLIFFFVNFLIER